MKVDFHVLEEAGSQASLRYVCSLIEKAYKDQQSVYVHTVSKEEASYLDTLLWTFSDESFVPHTVADESNDDAIQIGYSGAPAKQYSLLINLSREIPAFYTQFPHVVEIVFSDPIVQQSARDRFRQYRESGCDLSTHKINANERSYS